MPLPCPTLYACPMLAPDATTVPDEATLERERCLGILEERITRYFAGPRVELSLVALLVGIPAQ